MTCKISKEINRNNRSLWRNLIVDLTQLADKPEESY
jgi:hypothetical protein